MGIYTQWYQETLVRELSNLEVQSQQHWIIEGQMYQEMNLIRELRAAEFAYLEARIKARGIKVHLQEVRDAKDHLRFVDAIISRPTSFEPKRVTVCTTLAHKRRNAWDVWNLLGGQTGVPRPDQWTTRKETMAHLKQLYEVALPAALDRLQQAAQAHFNPAQAATATTT